VGWRHLRLILLVALVIVSCTHPSSQHVTAGQVSQTPEPSVTSVATSGSPPATSTPSTPTNVSIKDGRPKPPFAFASGNKLLAVANDGAPRVPEQQALLGALSRDIPLSISAGSIYGPLSRAVVPSPDHNYVLFESGQLPPDQNGLKPGDPLDQLSLHVVDLRSGQETLLERGAYAPAWRSDGLLAYAKGETDATIVGQRYLANVVVRQFGSATTTPWTSSPAKYIPVAWAGQRLVLYRQQDMSEATDLYVLDGPNRLRLLAPAVASLIALSPDGTTAAVIQTTAARFPDGNLVLLNISDGSEIASLDLSKVNNPVTGKPLHNLSYNGDWLASSLVASTAWSIVSFHVGPGSISVDHVLTLDTNQPQPEFPRFLSPTGDRVVARGFLDSARRNNYYDLDCSLSSQICSRDGPFLGYQIYNPSRP
jgi:hypothetical protein